MGYYSRFSLTVDKIQDAKESAEVITAQTIIEGLESGDLSKKEAALMLKQLTAGPVELTPNLIISQFRRECENARGAIDADGFSEDTVKWYDAETDVTTFSAKFPGWLFTLTVEGEESGDIWKLYAYGGKKQTAKAVVTFEPFDPAKLIKL